MKIAKVFNFFLTLDPKIELYANAEEKIFLDLKIEIKDKEHYIKMKVYNTTCAMDFQAMKHDIDKKFDHLNGNTVGEFFAKDFVVEIANIVCKKMDVEKLNNFIRRIALDGKNAVKTVKTETSKGDTKND